MVAIPAGRFALDRPRAAFLDWWQAKPVPAVVPLWQRLAVAALVGLLAGLLSAYQLTERRNMASDFTYALRAATRLARGLDPYRDPAVGPSEPYPFEAQLPSPIFAAVYAIPLSFTDRYVAGAIFVGLSAALLAFGLARDGWWRLAALTSPSFFVAMGVAQWSPSIMAAAFVPAALPLVLAKPTIGAAIVLFYGRARGLIACVVLGLLSLYIWPTWPLGWLESLRSQTPGQYVAPLAVFPGILVLAALWRWRAREARLLALLVAIPQHFFFYDQFFLWLIPRTWRQSLALSACGWIGYAVAFTRVDSKPLLAWIDWPPGFYGTVKVIVVCAFYLPAAALVLWQGYREHRAAS